MSELYDQLFNAIQNGRLVAVATVLAGPGVGSKLLLGPSGQRLGSLGSPAIDARAQEPIDALLAGGQSGRFTLEVGAETLDIFVDVSAPAPKLIIIGAVHIAIPLVTFAKTLGFQTIVLDARSGFATPERFAHADRLIIQWPADALPGLGLDESTCIVVLTHDEKMDNPALAVAVQSPARYIGALGSKKTHGRRAAALRELGVSDAALARIHAPIGLEIGARRPEEIAVAIIAEVVAVVNGVR